MPDYPVLRDGRTSLNPGVVSYNGFIFPPGIKSTAEFEPVYDDSQRIMKYMHVKLHIETYIFYGCLTRSSNILGYVASTSQGSGSYTSDSSMEEIRQRLCEPGQKLTFTYQGAGNITLQDPSSPSSKDVNNGPKPKMISWRPFANKMAYIVWECDAWFSPCDDSLGNHRNPAGIAQMPYSVSFSVNEKGFNTRVISGSVEISMSRRSTTERYASASRNFDTETIRGNIAELFPMMPRFQRTQDFDISQDRKTLSFKITDTEIESEEAYGPGCVHESVKLTASASLQNGGFHKWLVNLSGTIECAAGYPKSFAYSEMMRLWTLYYVLNGSLGEQADDRKGVTGNDDKPTSPNGSSKKSVTILQSVKLSDNLFGKDISFDFSWGLFTTPSTLFKATGLFHPINPSLSDQDKKWNDWKTSLSYFLDSGGYNPLNMDQNDDLIVSLCQPTIKGTPTPPKKPKRPKEEKEKPFKVEGDASPTASSVSSDLNLYACVDPQFHIERKNNTIRHVALKDVSPVTPTLNANKATSPGMDFGTGSGPQTATAIHHKVAPTDYVLVFKGRAVRLGHPVPIPEVKSYRGVTLTKVGDDILLPRRIGTGIDAVAGNDYSIHELIWEQRYSLPSPPINSIIETDAQTWLYQSGPGGVLG